MPRTIGIIAAPAEAEVASALASQLSSDQCTCVLDAAGIDAAPVAIVVCSSRAEPTMTMAGQVERAFARRARLLPVLLDLPTPPRQISHFIAGLRSLECTRAELPAAAARLRAVIARLPPDPPSLTRDEVDAPARQPDRPVALDTWSRVARGAALACVAFASWRLVVDITAVGAAAGDPSAFATWARRIDRLALAQAPFAFATGAAVVGWLQASFRQLVLAHLERHVRSWRGVMGGYALALIYPPLAIATVSRVWTALAEAPPRSIGRIVVVTVWWVAVVTSGSAPMIASIMFSDSFLDLGALAINPPDATERQWLIRLLALGNATSIIGFALTVVIVRGQKLKTRRERRDVPASTGTSASVLLLAAPANRLIADALARQLQKHGVDLFASNPRRPPDPEDYDALLVLGRGHDQLTPADALLMDHALQTGRVAIVPVCWRSESPPPHLQRRLGPLHWHSLSPDDASLERLAAVLLRSSRRREAATAPGTRLGTSRMPGLTLVRAFLGAFALTGAWAISGLGRSLADFEFNIVLLAAAGADLSPLAARFPALLSEQLTWRSARLLPALAAAAGMVWVLGRLQVYAASEDAVGRPVLFETSSRPRRAAQWIAATLGAAAAAAWLEARVFALVASSALALILTVSVFATVGAARARVRLVASYWDATPTTELPAPGAAVPRSWMTPLVLTAIVGFLTIMQIGFTIAVFEGVDAANANPGDQAAAAAAAMQAQSLIVGDLIIVHVPCGIAWWWWLGRRAREARAAGRSGVSRGRRALALVPLVGHADLPAIVREATRHRYGSTSAAARLAGALVAVAATAWTISVLWLLSAVPVGHPQPIARTLMTSTFAFLVFGVASTLLWWLIGLVRGARAIPEISSPRDAQPARTG